CDYMYSTDVVGQNAKGVFVLFFGSWFAEWDDQDDLMRSVLATSLGLTSCESGRPHWFLHHMGLGMPIGYSTRLSMNNSAFYQTQSNKFTRAVFISLMGDPTLRQDPVAPAGTLSAKGNSSGVTLNWSASTDNVVGYNVYRAATSAGPFTRLNNSLISGTQFADTLAGGGQSYTYMVRAVALEVNPSGSFFDPSQGIFTTVTAPGLLVQGAMSASGLQLSWNSQPGASYVVQCQTNLNLNLGQNLWSNFSGTINATGTVTTWIDSNAHQRAHAYYRVVTE